MNARIQLRRTKGWSLPVGAVVVARPSRWGNPFAEHDHPERACEAFREWLTGDGQTNPVAIARRHGVHLARAPRYGPRELMRQLPDLAGHDLACWCALEDADGNRVPCHADVLLDLAADL